MLYINSKENNTFKKIKKLKQKKYREQANLFLAEGIKFLDFDEVPKYILVDESFDYKNIEEKIERFDCEKIILPSSLFSIISSQENSQGIILVYSYESKDIENIDNNVIILDKVSDPGNLGTIIRTVDAAGFKDIILTKGSVDCYNEKTIRSTMGSIFNVNLYYVDDKALILFLKENGYRMISATLEKDSVLYNKMNIEKKNAIIFGNEGNGISRNMIDASDEKVIIPIYGSAESLNVAMACGIILYKAKELMEEK
ncbi:TrmH family RNA methyltransferase [Fusobacterium sp. MFO224]|uniref:TrmH family RNA methyltransferase n=1 Tax=Fusobacterium sp. MFO224 TaxID=3378070 RepID=UPI00385333C7